MVRLTRAMTTGHRPAHRRHRKGQRPRADLTGCTRRAGSGADHRAAALQLPQLRLQLRLLSSRPAPEPPRTHRRAGVPVPPTGRTACSGMRPMRRPLPQLREAPARWWRSLVLVARPGPRAPPALRRSGRRRLSRMQFAALPIDCRWHACALGMCGMSVRSERRGAGQVCQSFQERVSAHGSPPASSVE